MSCHHIGKGLNNVAKSIFEEYEKGNISFETLKHLLIVCRDSVDWCDGNPGEAIALLEDSCGVCLQEKKDLIRVYYDVPKKYDFLYKKLENTAWRDKMINNNICEDCLKTLFKEDLENIQ